MSQNEIHKLNILLADLRNISPAEAARTGLSDSPAEKKNKTGPRLESVIARRLTAAALETYLGYPPSPAELAGEVRHEGGKPCFPAYPDFHYNISHSGDHVVLCTAGQPVGIDIQQITKSSDRALKIAGRFFTEAEINALKELLSHTESLPGCTDDNMASLRLCTLFTRFWAARESYIKLTGLGLAEPFSNFRPDLDSGLIYRHDSAVPESYLAECDAPEGYCMTVCTYKPVSAINIINIPISDI